MIKNKTTISPRQMTRRHHHDHVEQSKLRKLRQALLELRELDRSLARSTQKMIPKRVTVTPLMETQ